MMTQGASCIPLPPMPSYEEMSSVAIPQSAPTPPDIPALLKAGSHFSEIKGSETHIIDCFTGKTLAILTGAGAKLELTASGIWIDQPNSLTVTLHRHVDFSLFTLQALCQYIAEGMPLTKACLQPNMPSYNTLCRWRRENPEVREALEQAYIDRADTLRDKAMQAALEATDKSEVDVATLRHNAYKWAAGVDAPRYSPKAKVDLAVNVPTQIIVQTGIDRGNNAEDDNNGLQTKTLPSTDTQEP